MTTPTKKPGRWTVSGSKLAIVVLGMLVLYALLGFLLAPWLIRQQLPELAAQHLNAQASVSAVRINPFLLTLEATDLAVAEKNGAPVLKIARLFVDFEAGSLLRRAWTLRELAIDRPVITADLNAQESLNLTRLLRPTAAKPGTAPAAREQPLRFLLQHFVVTGASISYTDHTVQPAARVQFNPVNFEVHDLSTLPDQRGEHTMTARLPGGGRLQWHGKITLAPIDSSGSIALKDAKLATLWRFVQDDLAIAEPAGSYDLGLRYRIRSDRGGFAVQASDLSLRLKDVALTQPQGGAQLGRLATLALLDGNLDLRKRTLAFKEVSVGKGEINVTLDQDGTPDWAKLLKNRAPAGEGPATPAPAWQITLPSISIGPLALSMTDRSRVRPLQLAIASAEAGFGITATTGAEAQVILSNGALKLGDLGLRSGDNPEPLITLGAAELTNGAYDVQKKAARADLVQLSGGRLRIDRDADGKISLLDAFAALREKPAAEADINLALGRLELTDYAVMLSDGSYTPAAAYDLEKVRAKAEKITLPFTGAIPVELAFTVKQGGSVQANGTIDGQGKSADVRLEATDIALSPLDGVLRHYSGLTLATGKAGGSGRVLWNGKGNRPTTRFSGAAALTAIELNASASGERLITWQSLSGKQIEFDSAANRFTVAQLDLARPYAKLVINKNRSTNLSAAMRGRKATTAAPAAATTATSPLTIRLDRLGVERGAMDFSDLSLVLPFATHIQALNGSVSGLSSAPESRASLKFEGRVAEFGLARAEGTLQPFAPKAFTDVEVSFRNVALPPLSPYTATFAGRTIAAGKLSLQLEYKLDNGRLAGDNRLLLEQLTLGERVESPTALDLPLDLAVALLTDSAGNINLTVPVSGDVDKPEFSYGQVISQAIGASITGIVTAPFRALAAIFGGNAQELSDIVFDPGSTRILPTEYEKMRRVAEGMRERPQLKLMVQGLYHRERDGEALRAQAVRAALAVREGLTLSQREDPGPVGFANAKTQRAIEVLFDEKNGGDAVAPFVAAFRKNAGREVKRVNALLAVTGEGGGDPALYEAMYQELITRETLSATALADLARNRATAISNALVNRFKFEPARLGDHPVAATDDVTDKGVPAKLSFAPLQ